MDIFETLAELLPVGTSLEEVYHAAPPAVWRENFELALLLALNKFGFDGEDYLERYPDVREAAIDPAQHFIKYGLKEGRTFKFSRQPEKTEIQNTDDLAILFGLTKRPSRESLLEKLMDYDVVSFDIFDTAIYRRVEFPTDIFLIMAQEMNWRDFVHIRTTAEAQAREERERLQGDREVTIKDIYERLEKYHNVEKKWMAREIELERSAAIANPYILEIFHALRKSGKTVVFSSDMYLPKDIIQDILASAGYGRDAIIYLSNDLKLNKLDGSMQKCLARDFEGRKIIHIGDNRTADYSNFIKEGIDAIWHPDNRLEGRDVIYENFSGCFYRGIINCILNNGSYHEDIYYTHGFKVGGILATGYCQFINKIARETSAEKIIFCGRDCYILQKIYDRFFKELPNVYVETSRNVLTLINIEYFANYFFWGILIPYWKEHAHSINLWQLLECFGLECLIPLLSRAQISKFVFFAQVNHHALFKFFINNIPFIKKSCTSKRLAAKMYYSNAIGSAKKAIIVDIGWSGTGFEALEHFIKNEIEPSFDAVGTLICAANSKFISSFVERGKLFPFISATGWNRDITTFLFPSGKTKDEIEKLHLPLEYLFTAPYASLADLYLDPEGKIVFGRSNNIPENIWQIERMQAGMCEFSRQYVKSMKELYPLRGVDPYMAFAPLMTCITDEKYLAKVYGDFNYDSVTLVGKQKYPKFSSIIDVPAFDKDAEASEGEVLLLIHELTYTGSLTYLLQVVECIRAMGLVPVVWAMQDGPFRYALEQKGIKTVIVPVMKLEDEAIKKQIRKYKLAICNTICTAEYAEAIGKLIPAIWIIHEGKNLPGFLNNMPERRRALAEFPDIYSVSEYAAQYIKPYASYPVRLLYNSVMDMAPMVISRIPGTNAKVRFCQIGTMERRKGYDVLVKAIQALPEKYRIQCEVHFAGGFISGEVPYCDWLFNEIEHMDEVQYHGQLTDLKEKTRFLANMDVIVVASRDESCSLVALEGAMLAKPLIVTENVGAKYMVSKENGEIVKTDDPEDLKRAMMRMIDCRVALEKMGAASRMKYETFASEENFNENLRKEISRFIKLSMPQHKESQPALVITLTSSPLSIKNAKACVNSLLAQECGDFIVEYWLSERDFPFRKIDLPAWLIEMEKTGRVEIHWTSSDLKGYLRFLAAMQPGRKMPIIAVDDNVVYKPSMARTLLESWERHPEALSCHRADMIMIDSNGELCSPSAWLKDYRALAGQASKRLSADVSGGVLLPPGLLPLELLDVETCKEIGTEYYDIWLSMTCIQNKIPVVVARVCVESSPIEGTSAGYARRSPYHQARKDTVFKEMLMSFKSNDENADTIFESLKSDV